MPATKQLVDIPGIGPATARLLAESGFTTVDAIAAATVRQLAGVRGFGAARAGVIIAAARNLMNASTPSDTAPAQQRDVEPAKKKKKDKKKRKKKDKKKKKKSGDGKKKGKKRKGKKKGKKKDGKKRKK